jgi:hypothetical protein
MRRLVAAAVAIGACAIIACAGPPQDPITLDGSRLTVDNRTRDPWTDVEIWLNTYYRITTPLIPAHGRFQTTLDTFVAGFGQRFDYRRTQVNEVRLKARRPDGSAVEIKMPMRASGLAGYLGGKR